MKRLEEIILDRIDNESLFSIYMNYPNLKLTVHEEWKRRLLSCDRELYSPLLDFLYTHNVEKSLLLKQGLYGLRKCFQWKFGVVYDFRTGNVKSLELRLGNVRKKYEYDGKPILFEWLDANENKMLLREIISSNANSSIFSLKLDKDKSEQVRDLLLDNKVLNLDVIVIEAMNKSFHSFPQKQPLSGGEEFVVYPYRIYNKNKSIPIYDSNDGNIKILSFSNIPIIISSEVKKYLDIISK